MGEVGCSIRLYGMLAGLGVCSLLVGGCRWHGAKSFLGLAEVQPNIMSSENGACSKVVVVASSHCKSPGSIPRRSQILAGKQIPILVIRNHFPGGETYQF